MYNSDTNPHPLGFIGEIMANSLLQAGWTERTVGLDAHCWVSPEGELVGRIEWAHERLSIAVRLEREGGGGL